jgi:hypothetical protein
MRSHAFHFHRSDLKMLLFGRDSTAFSLSGSGMGHQPSDRDVHQIFIR